MIRKIGRSNTRYFRNSNRAAPGIFLKWLISLGMLISIPQLPSPAQVPVLLPLLNISVVLGPSAEHRHYPLFLFPSFQSPVTICLITCSANLHHLPAFPSFALEWFYGFQFTWRRWWCQGKCNHSERGSLNGHTKNFASGIQSHRWTGWDLSE